jgi:hypothetical protein
VRFVLDLRSRAYLGAYIVTKGLRDEERAAAQAVQRVLGGTWEPHDTGAEPSQFDVLHLLCGANVNLPSH